MPLWTRSSGSLSYGKTTWVFVLSGFVWVAVDDGAFACTGVSPGVYSCVAAPAPAVALPVAAAPPPPGVPGAPPESPPVPPVASPLVASPLDPVAAWLFVWIVLIAFVDVVAPA